MMKYKIVIFFNFRDVGINMVAWLSVPLFDAPLALVLLNLKKYGIHYFVLPLGYKKKYFITFFNSFVNKSRYKIKIINNIKNDKIEKDKINVCLFDAGIYSTKLNRILQSLNYLKEEHFIATYGDGIADVNIKKLLKFHKKLYSIEHKIPEDKIETCLIYVFLRGRINTGKIETDIQYGHGAGVYSTFEGHLQKILTWRNKPDEFLKELAQQPIDPDVNPGLQAIIKDKLAKIGIE